MPPEIAPVTPPVKALEPTLLQRFSEKLRPLSKLLKPTDKKEEAAPILAPVPAPTNAPAHMLLACEKEAIAPEAHPVSQPITPPTRAPAHTLVTSFTFCKNSK